MNGERDRDGGFTFVELLIASALTLGVLATAGWMLLAALYGGRDVTASGVVSSQAQILANSIRSGVGSGADVELGSFAGDGQLLKATVAEFDSSGVRSSDWACTYWALTSDGRAYTKRSSTAVTPPAVQTSSAFNGWTLLASGLEGIAGSDILSRPSASSVGIKARSNAEGGAPAYVDTTATQRALPEDPGALAC